MLCSLPKFVCKCCLDVILTRTNYCHVKKTPVKCSLNKIIHRTNYVLIKCKKKCLTLNNFDNLGVKKTTKILIRCDIMNN